METREKGTRRKKRTLRSRKRRNMGKRGARRARQRVVVSVVRRGVAALVIRDTQLNSKRRAARSRGSLVYRGQGSGEIVARRIFRVTGWLVM